ncbi:helix-turn-helix domain-containing protein [Embleya scabrispora]|uniref:helix-turn-helix domain-containing protein n=1 Tax=Embleya scabrispora TaxID=159449 RepID=UPI000373E9F9|nr:helix-turn-helix domain-containing protein [Embleya scabrispora]MYS83861.1 helix-turn-helix domain-containing protein [Streptomyces sp. SID5474]
MVASPPTDRVVAVVELLAAAPRGLSVSEVAARLDLNRSTATAVLAALAAPGWVQRGPDRLYTLGPGLLAVADAVHARVRLPAGAAQVLATLAGRVGCGVALSLVGVDHVVFLAVEPGPGLLPAGIEVGTRLPLRPPAGASVMPWRPAAERAAWLAHAPELAATLDTIRAHGVAAWRPRTDSAELLTVLRDVVGLLDEHPGRTGLRERVREQLASISAHPYTEAELTSDHPLPLSYLAAPIRDTHGHPTHELQIGPLRDAVGPTERHKYITALQTAATHLSPTPHHDSTPNPPPPQR